jgi:hypothetical protein
MEKETGIDKTKRTWGICQTPKELFNVINSDWINYITNIFKWMKIWHELTIMI